VHGKSINAAKDKNLAMKLVHKEMKRKSKEVGEECEILTIHKAFNCTQEFYRSSKMDVHDEKKLDYCKQNLNLDPKICVWVAKENKFLSCTQVVAEHISIHD